MSVTELDPLFVKGLRLLHSKSRDSADQLKQLLDDAIAQSKSSHTKERTYSAVKLESEGKLLFKKSRDISDLPILTVKHAPEERKAEKRQFEKLQLKQESSECSESKIPKLESPQVLSYYPPSPDIPKLEQFVPRKVEDEDTDSSDENADADDFAMGMGLACVICKQIDVSLGNQLIECQECHSLYHQECHRPPATDYDVNDPRRVWYCAKCMKNMKKMATKTQKPPKNNVTSIVKEPTTQTKCSKAENSPPSLILPFKRSEIKAPVSQGNTQSSTNKPTGLAGLAANLSARAATSSSASSSLSSRTSASKAASALTLKGFASFATASKAAASSSSSSSLPKLPLAATPSTPSSAPPKLGLGLLSAAMATSASARSVPPSAPVSTAGNGGGTQHAKMASCSPLMNADKRVQIMKKKAAKMQEKRRLSTK